MQESYQSQTGQVAPPAQNPQNNSLQPYQQQSGEGLQTSTNDVLQGQSGVRLVLPDGESFIAPSGTTQVGSAQTNTSSNNILMVFPAMLTIAAVVIFVFLIKSILKKEDNLSEQETTEPDDSIKPIVVIDASEENIPEKPLESDSINVPSKKPTKKSKKRKSKKKKSTK